MVIIGQWLLWAPSVLIKDIICWNIFIFWLENEIIHNIVWLMTWFVAIVIITQLLVQIGTRQNTSMTIISKMKKNIFKLQNLLLLGRTQFSSTLLASIATMSQMSPQSHSKCMIYVQLMYPVHPQNKLLHKNEMIKMLFCSDYQSHHTPLPVYNHSPKNSREE